MGEVPPTKVVNLGKPAREESMFVDLSRLSGSWSE
jgi:hypothetical protein